MISDKIPKTWDLALRWCKCRGKWINYVYDSYIKPYNSNVMKSKQENIRLKSFYTKVYTREIAPKKGENKLTFIQTIKVDDLLINDFEEYQFWQTVYGWVKWFADTGDYIRSSADIYLDCKGYTIEQTAQALSKRYKVDVKLVMFIINYEQR